MSDPTRGTMITGAEADPHSVPTLYVGLLGTIALILVILGVEVLFYRTTATEHQRKAVLPESRQLGEVRAEQQAILDGYRWIDPQAGRVAIPIDRAMELMVDEVATGRGDQR